MRDITLCSHGRTSCAHRETPYGGFPTEKQSTGLFALISGIRPKLMLLPFPAFRLRRGFRALRRDDGIYFVIFVLLFAVAHRVSSVFDVLFKLWASFCNFHHIVCIFRTETPNFCLGGGAAPRPCQSFATAILMPFLKKGGRKTFNSLLLKLSFVLATPLPAEAGFPR